MPDRRQFLLTAAAGLADAAAVRPARIIDTHTHFYDPARPQGVPWPPKSDPVLYRSTLPERYVELVRPLGVTGTVAIEASPWLEDNQWLLELARDNPIIVAVVGHLEPGAPEFARNLGRFRANRLFRGIRVGGGLLAGGLGRPAFVEDLRRLADAGLELDLLGGKSLLADAARLNDRIPSLRLVIDHMPNEPARDPQGWRELRGRPAVYSKVSGVLPYRGGLDELWETFGPERVLYGSNWPVSDRVAPYAAVLDIVMQYFTAKGQDAADRFFWKNSQAAYGWEGRKTGRE